MHRKTYELTSAVTTKTSILPNQSRMVSRRRRGDDVGEGRPVNQAETNIVSYSGGNSQHGAAGAHNGTIPASSFKIGTLNVGTLTGKSHELSGLMIHDNLDILCLQETRWYCNEPRLCTHGNVLYMSGSEAARSWDGVAIMVKGCLNNSVHEVKRTNEHMMTLRVLPVNRPMRIVCCYAPRKSRPAAEKAQFWIDLANAVSASNGEEDLVICGDFNAHVKGSRAGYESCYGGFAVGDRNEEGVTLLDFVLSEGLCLVNTFFSKSANQLITYELKPGVQGSTIDYILVRAADRHRARNCRTIEALAPQHRLVMMELEVEAPVVRKARRPHQPRAHMPRVQRLRERDVAKIYKERLTRAFSKIADTELVSPEVEYRCLVEACKREAGTACGMRRLGARKLGDTYWWDDSVKEVIKEKERAFSEWKLTPSRETELQYKELCLAAKRAVAEAKARSVAKMFPSISNGGAKAIPDLFALAKRKKSETEVPVECREVKDEDGLCLTDPIAVKARWRRYFENLLNVENAVSVTIPTVEESHDPDWCDRELDNVEVEVAIRTAKLRKAPGPDGLHVEMLRAAGSVGVKWLARVFRAVWTKHEIPDAWTESVISPLYKGKGDRRECSNNRGIKLLSVGLKLFERVLQNRLRMVVEEQLGEEQHGFRKGRSSLDLIGAIRRLAENRSAKGLGTAVALLDLEKAYDRVPRWLVMKILPLYKVSTALCQLVEATYRKPMTRVRTPFGESDNFEVKVGLHQGSVISPLLFILLMDRVSRAVVRGSLSMERCLFADDIAVLASSEQELQGLVLEWDKALRSHGMTMNVGKSKVMWLQRGNVEKLQLTTPTGTLEQVEAFTYLGSVITQNLDSDSAVAARIVKAYEVRRKLSGLFSDPKMPMKLKSTAYKVAVRASMTYGLDTCVLLKKSIRVLSVAEMRFLRIRRNVRLLDKKSNKEIRKALEIVEIERLLKSKVLRTYGHIVRMDAGRLAKIMLKYECREGKRKRGRPFKTYGQTAREFSKEFLMQPENLDKECEDRRMFRALTFVPETVAAGRVD